ncbi:uncharacterized protein LOC117169730 [Belonocnema kinseyi]|uniref:uncharacterized protein LOC117169730 n=1 Tax=Belonocnema kinseyi TaxID=2817044 RepID=UPI00143CCAC5|nr:uncharacterized protein LOC117169730 [Belonocnema kinseyi]
MKSLTNVTLTILLLCRLYTSLTGDIIDTDAIDEESLKVLFGRFTAQRISESKYRSKEWLNVSMGELRNKCSSKGNGLYDFPVIVAPYRDRLEEMFHMNMETTQFQKIDVNSMDCSRLPDDLAVKLEAVIDALQNCFDEEDRLDQFGKEKAMEIVLNEICLRIKQFAVYRTQDSACQSIVKDFADTCDLTTPAAWYSYERQSIYYMLLMFTVPETDSCTEIITQRNCYQSAVKHCSDSFRKAIQVLSSPPESTICFSLTGKQDMQTEKMPHILLESSDYENY